MRTGILKRKKIKPITLRDATIVDDGKLRKVVTVASLGNVMEQFDFGVYGFIVYTLGKVFFPGVNPSMQMVATLATFPVPFLIQPLSGLFFGMLGDKYGRQKIPAIATVIMPISTFCIDFIPSYASIDIWAPALLLLCKMTQGLSVGGEYVGASTFVAEHSPDRKRGFMGNWLGFGSITGFVSGTDVMILISTVTGEDNFLEWGQCIPFFLALPSGLIGLYLCHALKETPALQRHVDKLEQGDCQDLWEGSKALFKEIATKHWRSLLACVDLVTATNATYYILLTCMPSYLSHNLHYSEDHGALIIITIMIGMLFMQPIMGLPSDHFGRRSFIIMGSAVLFVLAIPAFILTNSNAVDLILAGLLTSAVTLNCFTGVMAPTLPAMFPTRIHYSVPAVTFNISVLTAGLALTLATWLVENSQNLMVPTYYLMVIAVVGLITGVTMKEMASQPLKGATPAAPDIQEAEEILGEHYDNIEQKIEDIDQEITELQAKRARLVQQHPRIKG